MGTACFYDNLHQVHSIPKDWKAKTLQQIFSSETSSLNVLYFSMVFARSSTVNHFVLFRQKYDCHRKFLILICWNLKNRLFWMYKSKSFVTLMFSLLFVVLPFLYHRQHLYRIWLYELHGRCLIRSRKCWHFASTWGYHGFHVGHRCSSFSFCLLCWGCFFLSCVLCAHCWQFLQIVHSWLTLRFSLTFICPVSCVPIVDSASRLSILDWPFGFL